MTTTTAATFRVVTGEHAAEHVARRRRPGEPLADRDALHRGIDPDGTAGAAGRQLAHAAWCALIDRARAVAGGRVVWIVHPHPTPDQRARYVSAGYELVDTGPPHPETGAAVPKGTGTAANVQAATKRHENIASIPRRTDGWWPR
ncbi:hypothetical protein M1843_04900 [Isoptericola sp. 4D.3]|uniref:Uncharacterized protein n=1 Tax=Isoptericola peretonis TaxID=2918523 RepID=A0ABT0J0R1_9MICO|nr:hypothetical protein [Isoptericola sp. 4D.3]